MNFHQHHLDSKARPLTVNQSVTDNKANTSRKSDSTKPKTICTIVCPNIIRITIIALAQTIDLTLIRIPTANL